MHLLGCGDIWAILLEYIGVELVEMMADNFGYNFFREIEGAINGVGM